MAALLMIQEIFPASFFSERGRGKGSNQPLVLRGEWTKLYQIREEHQLPVLPKFLLDFHCVAPFRKEDLLEGDWSRKSKTNVALFDPVKFRGGVEEISESTVPVRPMTKPLIYFLMRHHSTVQNIIGRVSK